MGDEVKADQNTDCNGVESFVTITCIAGLFYSVLSSSDLHCTDRIKTINTPTLNIEGRERGVDCLVLGSYKCSF